ncbi:Crp/Fnr family transcriptional regulator [Shewanella sp. 202IG2-18]|uniref:Crp/Fnr family transcriptional regulator n=1 Tax=Parashewanella hymeniacidonis TaxID=2807618 RepID=UPI00195F7FDE|nr:Crp/Fnr family transcriptional regulator [Parashewanella hymeniacidonis]MBM7070841.1 Crp/Fnr family transcriptional regulator [Parashewanella hymeniacidonis]
MIKEPYIKRVVHQHHLFKSLEEAELMRVMNSAALVHLNPNENLFFQGEPANRFYLLLHGKLQLFRSNPQGQDKVIEVVREGHTFAEALMFNKQANYPVSSQAVSECQLISFDNDSYRKMLKHNSEACMAVMSNMSVRLRKNITEVEELSLQNAQSRLLLFFMRHMQITSENTGRVKLDIPKRVLASRLSIQPETFSRLMKKMTAKELISESGHNIIIHDMRELYAIVDIPFETTSKNQIDIQVV